MNKKVVIIGSGVAALATAVRLAHNNYQVTVLEANSYVGGKLCETHHNGFRFDRGPSLFTMPFLVDELLDLDKRNRLPFEYEKLNTVCNYFFADGVNFTAYSDTNKFINELKSKLDIEEKAISNYLEHSKKTYQLIGDLFLQQSLQPSNFLNLKTLKALFHLPHYRLLKTLHQHNQAILKHPKLVQYFDRFATYNGSNPYLSPAMLAIVSHIEHGMGAFFPKKGMYQITDTLYNLGKKFGVEFKLNCPVSKINTSNDRVISVNANGTEISADIVVSNMDVFHTYKKLLPNSKHPDKILNQEKSSSALIFYWGINKTFPELDLHNIFFSADYQQEFDHIFNKKEVYHDPTIYINVTSKKKTDDAPEGCENWFVMINAPNNNNQDWEAIRQTVKQNCIKKLNAILQTNIEEYIVFEDHLDPVLIEERTSSYKGALYGNASNNKMAAFLRHPNSSKTINGLYFCGGSVHPGGGIPLALLSGKITAELITKNHN